MKKINITQVLTLISTLIMTISCSIAQKVQEGKFIIMPDNQEATFKFNLKEKQLTIFQKNKTTHISLQQALNFENNYSVPPSKKLKASKSKVLHISKDVFNNGANIEALIELVFKAPDRSTENTKLFYLIAEDGSFEDVGHPADFAIINNKVYGVDEKRYSTSSKVLNAIPKLTNGEFTNGKILYEDMTWEYCKQEGISVDNYFELKRVFIKKLIGPKNKSKTISHTIQYYDQDYNPTDKITSKINVVATYKGDRYYNNAMRSIFKDLATCDNELLIPFLINYVDDYRILSPGGDDFGATKVNTFVERALREVAYTHPELLKNYKKYVYIDGILQWWKLNKKLYTEKKN